jgi:formylglycine-generating enzyme required for sulfatase activity
MRLLWDTAERVKKMSYFCTQKESAIYNIMNKQSFFSIIAVAAMCITLFSTCKKDKEDNSNSDVEVISVTLNHDTLNLFVDETAWLIATILPKDATNKTVTWNSSNPAVATVNSGFVKALNIGTTTITIATENGNKTATCSVTVSYEWEPEMVFVEVGTFVMGCTDDECWDDGKEEPAHQVTLTNDYYIGKYEVTQKQWKAVMGTNPSYFKGDNLPVENVSWDDIQRFIVKLNEMIGRNYRLPTEAEWEYAARGGNQNDEYKYSGSNNIDEVAWYGAYSGGNSSEITHPVGTKAPNKLGIYDMSGNVWEWCQDWYGDYTDAPQTNPQGPAEGLNRVLRSGSWVSTAECCRVSNRIGYTSDYKDDYGGFRLVLVP